MQRELGSLQQLAEGILLSGAYFLTNLVIRFSSVSVFAFVSAIIFGITDGGSREARFRW